MDNIKFIMNENLFTRVKTPLLITVFVVLVIIFITIYLVKKEIKNDM